MPAEERLTADQTVALWGQLEEELNLAGRYQIVSRIGAGGAGEVFKARQVNIERDVAIKVLSAELQDNPTAKERFRREA